MLRIATAVTALLLALVAALPGAVQAAPAHAPKVVVIVGPVGPVTNSFRAMANEAAATARQYTPNVVQVYTPNATWPAVRKALQGASIVVYLGHGNGWPSRYRDALYPPSQNGFGLNPTAGGGDEAHQYFGEASIRREVKLAKDAVVVLSHLCYASGNTEPGLPEGTIRDARQRIDNYAAGFIDAGASAVIAEGHLGPAYYVRSLLAGNRSVARIWSASPNAKGHTTSFASVRTPGYTAMMDPDRVSSGFYRSIVLKSGVTSGQLNAGAQTAVAETTPGVPSLVDVGLQLGTPYLKDRSVAGAKSSIWIPYKTDKGKSVPAGLAIGVRWDPIDVAQPEPEATTQATAAAGTTTGPQSDSTKPKPNPKPGAAARPAPVATPGALAAAAPETPDADDPSQQRVSLVVPERLGSLVDPKKAAAGQTRIRAPLTMPTAPGRYRLVVTLHDKTGVAYDAATQALVKGLLVRVTGDTAAEYLVAKQAKATAGKTLKLPVGVANLGTKAWGVDAAAGPRKPGDENVATRAVLVARWISLVPGTAAGDEAGVVSLPVGLAPANVARVVVDATAPKEPGEYLLMLDVVVPDIGSLASKGIAPALVRVTVE